MQSLSTLPKANWREYCRWLLRRRRSFQVVGASMQPTLQPGDFVLATTPAVYNQLGKLAVGDIVIAQHPYQQNLLLIKRVQAIFGDGGCYLISDNAMELTAQDSRSLGIFKADSILGQVTSMLA